MSETSKIVIIFYIDKIYKQDTMIENFLQIENSLNIKEVMSKNMFVIF